MVKASLLQSKKRAAEAEKEWEKLISSYPKDWRVWKGNGYFHLNAKNHDPALACFKKYVELRPDTADSWESLAEGQLAKGEIDEATVNLKRALSIDRNYVPAVFYLAEAYEKKGLRQEAIETYQSVLSMASGEQYHKRAEERLKELR
jgi:tetratricopeptide (TPR) repeat protein